MNRAVSESRSPGVTQRPVGVDGFDLIAFG